MPTSASLNPKTADIFHRELRDFPSVDTALELQVEERMPSILSILTLSLLNPEICIICENIQSVGGVVFCPAGSS